MVEYPVCSSIITSPWAWCFWYGVKDLLREALWILEVLLESWSDSRVNNEEDMSPTFIVPELENTGKLTKDKNVNEEKETE